MPTIVVKGDALRMGLPPFNDPGFLADARRILSVPAIQFASAIDAVRQPAFVGLRGVRRLLRDHIADADARTSILNAYSNFRRIRTENEDDPASFPGKVAARVAEQVASELQPEEGQELARRIREIATASAGMLRQEKAEQLATAIGHELREFVIIADLRPIFDDDRRSIAGVMPVLTARLVLDDPDGMTTRHTLSLTEDDLDELAETVDAARRKLIAIRELAAAHVPALLAPDAPVSDRTKDRE